MVCPSRMIIQDDHTKGVKLISVIDYSFCDKLASSGEHGQELPE